MLQAIFESEPRNYNTWCPYFPDRYDNPTVDDILRSVTPPSMEVSKGGFAQLANGWTAAGTAADEPA